MLKEDLVKIQNELKVPKAQTNEFGNYKYRSQDDILEAVKPLLLKHKLAMFITDELECIGERYYIRACVTLYSLASTSDGTGTITVNGYAREAEIKKGMDVSQITGAASSYARKYALNGMFLIDDMKDADTMNNTMAEPSELITGKQAAEISKLLTDRNADMDRFKSWLIARDVPSGEIKDIRPSLYAVVVKRITKNDEVGK